MATDGVRPSAYEGLPQRDSLGYRQAKWFPRPIEDPSAPRHKRACRTNDFYDLWRQVALCQIVTRHKLLGFTPLKFLLRVKVGPKTNAISSPCYRQPEIYSGQCMPRQSCRPRRCWSISSSTGVPVILIWVVFEHCVIGRDSKRGLRLEDSNFRT